MTTPPVYPSDEGADPGTGDTAAASAPVDGPDEGTEPADEVAAVSAVAPQRGVGARPASDSTQQVVSLTPFVWRMLAVLVGSVAVGVATGLIWHALVDLPVYQVGADGGAATSERGLAAVFGADATYSAIGAVVGIVIGSVGWRLFGHRGWIVTIIVGGSAVVAALVCWGVGVAQGPSDFAGRIATAVSGDQVPIDFALHTKAAIYLWPLFAVGTVMFASAFGRDRTSGW